MVNKKQKKAKKQSDSSYFLKLLVLIILGCFWLKIGSPGAWQIPLPIGLIIGLYLIRKEHLALDRKIQYGVLLVAMLVGFWAPIGLHINV